MNHTNTKTDIYIFGIILLEILIGEKPSKNESSPEFLDFPSIVNTVVLDEHMLDLFDVDTFRGLRSHVDDGLVQAV